MGNETKLCGRLTEKILARDPSHKRRIDDASLNMVSLVVRLFWLIDVGTRVSALVSSSAPDFMSGADEVK